MAGRPKNTEKTVQKTYSFFEADIMALEASSSTAKHIFRLGVLSFQKNPQFLDRINKQSADFEHLEKNVIKIRVRLESTTLKLHKYKGLLEEVLGRKITDPEM